MPLLADLSQVVILIICLMGAGLFSRVLLPEVPFCLHFCFAPLALIGGLFCLEHYLPLGQMPWLWIPWSLLSLGLVWKAGKGFLREPVLWYFLIGFGICFLWRFSFPDIWEISEMLPDNDHLVSYSAGGQLPAEDVWMKGTKDDSYYIFQFYAAGLIHRFIGCGPGLTYHLGYCALVGIGIAAASAGVQAATRSVGAGLLASLALILGGNGTTLLTPFMSTNFIPSPLAAMRFIGSYAMPATPEYKSDFGVWVMHFLGLSKVDAPMEYYSYIIMLGDFHPSLSSLAFFGLAILAIGVAETAVPESMTDKFCVTGAIATVIFLMISNTWIMPLQLMLVLCWLIYRWWSGRGDTWIHILGSAFGCFMLIFPYFSYFAYQSIYYPVHIEWVKERPPLLDWLAIMLPALVIWLACFGVVGRQLFARFVVIVGMGALVGTYVIYVHDIYGGEAAVFNTTLKWWPWAYALVLMLGLICVWPSRILRSIAICVLGFTILFNTYIFAQYWWNTSEDHMGRMDGYAWFTESNSYDCSTYRQLQCMPKGVMLESVKPNSADTGTSLALFTGHNGVGCWTGHEMLWHEGRCDIEQLANDRDKFYNGTLENPTSWLAGVVSNGVTYIAWLSRDNDRGLDIWPRINEQIKGDYDWHPAFDYREAHWGIWIRKK